MPNFWRIIALILLCALARLGWLIFQDRAAKNRHVPRHRQASETCSLAVFLGSGGHTSEALSLLSSLDFTRYTPRKYVVSEGDILSAEKAISLETSKSTGASPPSGTDYNILVIPRARRVHQSLFLTPPTALRSLLACVFHVSIAPLISSGPGSSSFADVLILNGPGTCFVLCVAVHLNRFLGRPSPRLIYVESFARVKSLSLSGKLLRPFVDRFLVQWSQINKGECRGWLV
ncbi:UDP-N-acetylglucosamine transferase subunit [Pleurotus pulmonarius]|nr:UDP-N-acetylglucosamine transferase subunit [Pleurotus pulmonarius]KAF4599827.1 UDP-N-acetylglucosamine transferase subunit [Pleurotus pulmonarius]